MTLEQRVAALEDAVRQLGAMVMADIDGLRATDAEVARQGRRQVHNSARGRASPNGSR
ncbi:MAG: hypothetical protein ACJ76S_07480 [Solirubrobacteraceae bacterium]|jgi:hypothetical protein